MALSQPLVRAGLLHVPQLDVAAGEAVARQLVGALRHIVIQQEGYAASDRRWIEDTLCTWCDEMELDLLFTIGGTLPAPGPSAQESVPEATMAVIERLVPGLAEAMRAYVREEFPAVSLHRGVAGIRGRSLIVNLPAGAQAATLFLEPILEDLPYILAHLRGETQAATLAEIVGAGEAEGAAEREKEQGAVPSQPAEETPDTKPNKPAGKGLDAEEFAAFLRRGKQGEV